MTQHEFPASVTILIQRCVRPTCSEQGPKLKTWFLTDDKQPISLFPTFSKSIVTNVFLSGTECRVLTCPYNKRYPYTSTQEKHHSISGVGDIFSIAYQLENILQESMHSIYLQFLSLLFTLQTILIFFKSVLMASPSKAQIKINKIKERW